MKLATILGRGRTLRPGRTGGFFFVVWLGILAPSSHSQSQEAYLTLPVELVNSPADEGTAAGTDRSNVVVWLSRADGGEAQPAQAYSSRQGPKLIQRNKSFEPHLLVVEIGTVVQFPNKDPFFHNIFSLYEGKPFDLGLYEAGSSRVVRFDRPGASFLFCNIHAEMSAVVVAVDTPYFGTSDRAGLAKVKQPPPGRYILRVWYERSKPEDLLALTRPVTITESTRSLPTVKVITDPNFTLAHKNKYGQDYVSPADPAYLKP